ncbi:hypothetical protein NS506_02645 [Nocardia seriolae]|uniref:Uncharacterized protein n=1 Tax=Nocardia seriolae TaxID=37332 RepID=A0ABC8ARD2_9NOCA|nr:hypothetical protein [Nocardia seriolae]APA96707.1 hypothetical protein NS506_02645 [Nocardia seriolae]
MIFYQTSCATGYECASFADLNDSRLFRDLGPEPRAAADWKPLELTVENTDERGRPLRAASVLTPDRTALAFAPNVQDALAEILLPWGEFLPATLDGNPMLLFHGTAYVDAFDPERSNTAQPRKILPKTEVVFRSVAEEYDILTVSTHPNYGLFYSERIVDKVQGTGLFAGVKFVEVAHTL